MDIISVKASGCYDVRVGSGILGDAATYVAAVTKARNLCIVSDETVWPLWGIGVCNALEAVGYVCFPFVIPVGEQEKQIETCVRLWEFLTEKGFDRQDCLIALGGGVVGDLTGFAAATYLRGIDFIQIPTTLLAMVDSSVGGKTGVNLTAGKNLAGAFYQPKAVLCDTDTLSTLPRDIFLDGCAEVIKYAVLFDPELFESLAQHGPKFPRDEVISRCIRWKAQVVAADEFDRGSRMQLNLGHSIGHGVEACSGYRISHGRAVAAGLACICRCAVEIGYMDMQVCSSVLALLEKFSLPITTDFTPEALSKIISRDKKRSSNILQFVIPREIGKCSLIPVTLEDLEAFIKKGL